MSHRFTTKARVLGGPKINRFVLVSVVNRVHGRSPEGKMCGAQHVDAPKAWQVLGKAAPHHPSPAPRDGMKLCPETGMEDEPALLEDYFPLGFPPAGTIQYVFPASVSKSTAGPSN